MVMLSCMAVSSVEEKRRRGGLRRGNFWRVCHSAWRSRENACVLLKKRSTRLRSQQRAKSHGGGSLRRGCEGWALDGVPMGSRGGELDVGILRYLLQQLLRQCSPRARFAVECFAVASPAISPRWR
jgi:hypothetical protein